MSESMLPSLGTNTEQYKDSWIQTIFSNNPNHWIVSIHYLAIISTADK